MMKVKHFLESLRGVYIGVSRFFEAIDSRTFIGIGIIVLGWAVASYPNVGTAGRIGNAGISPVGFGVYTLICGGLILRYPKSTWFLLLALPIILYALFFIDYVISASGSPAPVVIYILACLYVLKESGRDG